MSAFPIADILCWHCPEDQNPAHRITAAGEGICIDCDRKDIP